MLNWLTLAAARLDWLTVEVLSTNPGRWRYTINPGTELETRAKGRTWEQLLDTLIQPQHFAAIARSFEQSLCQAEEDSTCSF
ncbi:MAG: hypothetical protein HC771_23835 [Synechococcales cyanobacterium CRU_2_2]|nr:hypothetical protein [Synechococcales cyanobacterium CRU_2_2]